MVPVTVTKRIDLIPDTEAKRIDLIPDTEAKRIDLVPITETKRIDSVPDTSPKDTKINEQKPAKSTSNIEEIVVPTVMNGIPLAYHYDGVKICIIKGEEPEFDRINPGDAVELVQESTNLYDDSAVMLKSNSIKLGYLYRGTLKDMANDFISCGYPITSHIVSINDDEHTIKIFLGFYRESQNKRKPLSKNESHKVFKLTSNRNKEM